MKNYTRDAGQDGWLMAQIVKNAPDMATIEVAWKTLRDRHSPFFITDFESSFFESLGVLEWKS